MIHNARSTGKFIALVRWLRTQLPGLPLCHETVAVGLLERMWHFTMTSHKRGDIGASDNETIAEALGWHGDADALVSKLVETKWLNEHDSHRLVVHDWADHAPAHIKKNAFRWGGLIGDEPVSLDKTAQAAPSEPVSRDKTAQESQLVATPNLTKPNQTKQEAAPPPDCPITETEIAETPTDGPSPVTMLDGGEFVIEWNALAADHPCLVPHGATMLSRFEFENFRDRLGAGTWSDSWRDFQAAVLGGHVTSKGVTLKKLFDGAVLDVVVADYRRRKSAMQMSPPAKKRAAPELPAATKERPFRNLDRATIEEKIAGFVRSAAKIETDGGDRELATKFRKRAGELEAEREWRDANVQARRRECLEAGGINPPAGKEIPDIGRTYQ